MQRQRGDYQYNTADLYLRDIARISWARDRLAPRLTTGDQQMLFAFAQDDWRIRPNVSVEPGIKLRLRTVAFLGQAANDQLNLFRTWSDRI